MKMLSFVPSPRFSPFKIKGKKTHIRILSATRKTVPYIQEYFLKGLYFSK